jgi:DNA-binding NarL/FixJ family response regulator
MVPRIRNFESLGEGVDLVVGFPKAQAIRLGPAEGTNSSARDRRVNARLITAVGRLSPHPIDLSSRELEVLRQVASGLSDKQVARQLGISEKTVRSHLTRVYLKLQASNRVEAVINALRSGLLSL